MAGINKTVWTCWFQGWDAAPEIVTEATKSWDYYNPDWNIVRLTEENYRDYVDIDSVLPGLETNPTAFSDVLRLFLLKEHGGVWADATLFCNKPLDKWVNSVEDSFVFYRPDIMITSWFVVSKDNSYMTELWYDTLVDYWSQRIAGNDRYPGEYSWVHALFRECYKKDENFRGLFDRMDKFDASCYMNERGKGPHLFTPYGQYLNSEVTDEIKNRIDSQVDPVYKVTYKFDYNPESNSALNYLINKTK